MKTLLLFLCSVSLCFSENRYAIDPSTVGGAVIGNWNWSVAGKDQGWATFEAGGKFIYRGEDYTWKVSKSGIITVTRVNRQEATLRMSADLELITGSDFSRRALKATRRP